MNLRTVCLPKNGCKAMLWVKVLLLIAAYSMVYYGEEHIVPDLLQQECLERKEYRTDDKTIDGTECLRPMPRLH